MASLESVDVIALCCTALVLLYYRYKAKTRLPYPPGPKPLPLIGNLLDIPKVSVRGFEVFAKWSKDFDSDILHIDALGKHIVILNSVKVANELCGERSAIYSTRPHLTMLSELMNGTRFMAAMPYGDAWKARRRMFQHYFPSNDPSRIAISRSEEFVRKYLLPRILDSPEEFLSHIRNTVGGVTLSLAYGLRIKRFDDPWIKLAEEALSTTTEAAVVGRFLVDVIPALKYIPEWIPGAGFQKVAKEGRRTLNSFFDELYAAAVQDIVDGVAQPSFVSLALEENNETKLQDLKEVICETAGIFFAGGSETTVVSIWNFVLLMTLHPEVQEKARREVDIVIGHARFPQFSDKASMPYLTAVLKEVLRWAPIVPAGMPHCTTADDFIVVISSLEDQSSLTMPDNHRAMLHDEVIFPNPSRFDPERFLTSDGQLRKDILDPETTATFGFGRRACPGSQIGLTSLFIVAASFLSLFKIMKPVNAQGQEVDPLVEYTGRTMVDNPSPFECRFIPRSKEAAALIQAQVLNLDEEL
ncbi:hypothetical protein NP233_g8878 [Leucocoprinus birnbaumii]|uniref:Cytochrome P450 n=1 Tax=Leucocoprinus birnbaumii TaxID=56174 RepID=A0AAD5VM55_9AGAR|nr:hypothetical protein NP233_g8878 [Leucocoprinus birnbaumii]